MHIHEASPRSSFAQAIRARRASLADETLSRASLSEPIRSRLVVRTLIEQLASVVETGDPAPALHWAHTVRRSHHAQLLLALVETACELILASAEDEPLDYGALALLLEIVKAHVAETLDAISERRIAELTQRTAIETVLAALKAKDEATCAHSFATGEWCRRLANGLALEHAVVERIVRGGVLHDVGKLATPDAILLKTGPLDADEWAQMLQHAAFGGEILSEIPALATYAPIVRAHHERIDGRGYPDGLAGEQIPFEARVVSVADAFHAMISDRPYRKAFTPGEALEILREGSGRQWDAQIVDVLVSCVVADRNAAVDVDLAQLTPLGGPLVPSRASLAG
jgi:HD-GYP domain-containing protein (c-di-GMP phosphodiesterase class II)